jgi:hypothetical protein
MLGGTAGVTGVSCTNDSTTAEEIHAWFQSSPGELDGLTIAAGNWTVGLNITSAQAAFTYTKCFICHLNSSGTSIGTIGSVTGLGISLGTTGVKTATVSGSQVTFGTSETFVCCLLMTCNTSSIRTFQFTPNATVVAPGTVSAAVWVPLATVNRYVEVEEEIVV